MPRFFVSIILSTLFISIVAVAGSDPIAERQELMEDTRDAAKAIGGMLKEQRPFDAKVAMASLETWKKTATASVATGCSDDPSTPCDV